MLPVETLKNYPKLFKASEHPIHLLYVIMIPILILLGTIYDYYLYKNSNPLVLFIIKPLPVCLMITCGFVYMCMYKIHCYAQQMTISLWMCLIGDVFLMFYSPPEFEEFGMLILGGVAFFVARVCMSVTFLLYPYSFSHPCLSLPLSVKGNRYRLLIALILSVGYLAAAITFVILKHLDIGMSIFLFIYLLSMSLQLCCACLRVGGFEIEIKGSQVFGLIGTILFTISDSLLLYDMFIDSISMSNIISINLYWLGLYFLTISMVRSDSYRIEKSGSENFPLVDDF